MTKYLVKTSDAEIGVLLPDIQLMWLVGKQTWENRVKPIVDEVGKCKTGCYIISTLANEIQEAAGQAAAED